MGQRNLITMHQPAIARSAQRRNMHEAAVTGMAGLASSIAHLTLMHVPPGVGGQPRVVDAVHQRVCGQPLCNAPRVGHLCRGVEVCDIDVMSGVRQQAGFPWSASATTVPTTTRPMGASPHTRQPTQAAQLPPTCRSMRRLMVLRPRTSSQQSKGPSAEPSAFCAMT